MKKILLITLCSLGLTGCATLISLADGDSDPYSGVRMDVACLIIDHNMAPYCAFDFPFSLVGDTLLLPVQLIRSLN